MIVGHHYNIIVRNLVLSEVFRNAPLPSLEALQCDVHEVRLPVLDAIDQTWEDEMKVHWLTDADAALAQAKTSKKPLLIDFSAAPA
jgi:hypothetical protein